MDCGIIRRKMRSKSVQIFLSVIVPVYNEAARLDGLTAIFRYLQKQKYKSELIVVDDGSTDKTLEKLQKLDSRSRWNDKLKLISYPINQGKGRAVKIGMLTARGKYRLFIDVDLSTPIETLVLAFRQEKKSDIIIGSRRIIGSQILTHQPWIRETLGRGFTRLSQLALGVPVTDFTCGFKLFSAKSAIEIFGKSRISGWGFDSEILFIARKMGYRIRELPVSWVNDGRTRVRFPLDIIRSLVDLLAIRWYEFTGKYG